MKVAEGNELQLVTETTTEQAQLTLPTGRDLRSPRGRVTGQRYSFGSNGMTKAEIRANLKSTTDLKGRKLSAKVEEVFGNDGQQRKLLGGLFVDAMIQEGFVPDYADQRSGSAVLRMVKAKGETPKVDAKELETKAAEQAKEIAELKAKLAKLEK